MPERTVDLVHADEATVDGDELKNLLGDHRKFVATGAAEDFH